jgi:thioredoxin reductase (NADPH)
MLVRKDHFRASKAMQNRLSNYNNIKVLFNHEVIEVMGENVVDGIKIKNNLTNDLSKLEITGLFIAIGHSPNTDIFKGIVDMDDSGYIITDKISTKTNIPGVFAAGDVQDKDYRQAVTAAGTGCMAALDAERYLQEV